MTIAYVTVGFDFNEIQSISTTQTVEHTVQVILDNDLVDFSKPQGYVGYTAEDGQNHLKFDQDKYDRYLAGIRQKELEEKQKKDTEQKKADFFDKLQVEYEESDKEGYKYKILRLGDMVVSKEYVPDDDVILNDGTDYTRAIVYKEGMSVEIGLWYTDGTAVWECIKEGTPESFADEEYFDIIK